MAATRSKKSAKKPAKAAKTATKAATRKPAAKPATKKPATKLASRKTVAKKSEKLVSKPIRSTMMDFPLSIRQIFERGARVYPDSRVITWSPTGSRITTYREIADNTGRLANALKKLGIKPGDRVATVMWNDDRHMEVYFAVPCMGAVLHPLNLRLFPDQFDFIVKHADDRVIIVHDSLVPLVARSAKALKRVTDVIVVGDGPVDPNMLAAIPAKIHRYADLLAPESSVYRWPTVEETDAAAICYTTGTTGDPKGVAYSHRSVYLHSFGAGLGATIPLTEHDMMLPIVPMFHVLAWGLPFGGWSVGADFLMPEKFLQAEPIAAMVTEFRPTMSAAVPTIWNDLLRFLDKSSGFDITSLKFVVCGGSAVPRALIEGFIKKHGVPIVQGWGMTETSPLCALAHPPRGVTSEKQQIDYRAKTGRIVSGVELRICDDEGTELSWDGKAVGEIEVRGPWITGSYIGVKAPEKFHDGWLRTGDVGSVDPDGFIQITDRSKDVIKSGGEWISSVEVESLLIGAKGVIEAAVIGIPDDRWDERPLACVVLEDGAETTPGDLRAHLEPLVAKWWIPEYWTFIKEVPKTSVGKYDKKVLRARHATGDLKVVSEGKAAKK
jgi:fatty-acyl-CoA synthase